MHLTQEELRKAQLLMLKILKEVHRICEENNIKYFLSDGTLIGAVRHNGFIPWDDDLDIGMLREEYEKFCKIAPEKLGDEFVLQTTFRDEGYGSQFGKLMLKNTIWIEYNAKDTDRDNKGIYIDIFPYDKIPSSKKKQKMIKFQYHLLNALLLFKLNYFATSYEKGIIRKINYVIKKIFSSFFSINKLKNMREKLCKKYENMSKNFVVTKYGGSFENNQNSYESYDSLILHSFENDNFYIPKNYDSILTNLYGDYMVIPPVEKQKSHGIIYFDFGNY